MTEPFIGMIMIHGFNFPPRGWQLCNGQMMSIAQNTALFSLLGTSFGGNGQTTFALPDLRGRSAIHWGNGPGLTPLVIGETGGTETVTLLSTNMPAHNHTMNIENVKGNTIGAAGTFLSIGPSSGSGPNATTLKSYVTAPSTAPVSLASQTIGVAGGSQPFNVQSPFLAITHSIATEGIFPSRN